MFTKIKARMAGVERPFGIKAVLNRKEFMQAIRCERSRCDRSGQEFSLVIFDARDGNGTYERLFGALTKRIRLYDIVGWYDENRPAVLLPLTAKETAENLCREFSGLLEKDGLGYEIR